MTQTSKRYCCSGLEDEQAPGFFKALCDPTRISILVTLARCPGELTVSQVAGYCPTDLSVVSRHLATLRDAGVLKSVKRGKEVYYTVRADALVKSLRAIADEIETCCPAESRPEAQEESTHE
jgi:ArsR family transcriptional regulator